MDKARLEAFSDGVFAIVVTLLVLDIKLPVGTTEETLGQNIIHVLPALGTYVLSYLIVGLYWIFHHRVASLIKSIDSRLLWLNIIYLMCIGLIPFTTSMLSEFIFSPTAIAGYGLNLVAITVSGFLIVRYLYAHKHLMTVKFTESMYESQRQQYVMIALLYALGALFGFLLPEISIFIYVSTTIYLILGTVFPRLWWMRRMRGE